jgi:hypothetical protein
VSYDAWVAVLAAPILILVSLPVLARQANREGDRALFWLLVIALILKLGGGLARHHVAFEVYEDADAQAYHEVGLELAEAFRAHGLEAAPESLTRSNFVRVTTGLMYALIGPSKLTAFLFFSWLGFWGLFYFYRAFRLAVPEGRSRSYARLLFFLPSVLFWPSSIGKESLLLFGLGIAAFGVARVLTGSIGRGVVITFVGLWPVAMVRAYLAAFMAVGLVAGYVARRPARQSQIAPVAKLVTLVALSIGVVFFLRGTETFLEQSGVDPRGGVRAVSEEVTFRTAQGGSEFTPHPVVQEPLKAPIAVFTVLFRPLPVEAHNPLALIASVEAAFLLLVSVVRFRWGLSALASIRRQPYLAFALVYVGLSIAALSVVGNFGILTRQRSLLLPLFLVFLAVPPLTRRGDAREEAPAVAGVGQSA